MKIMAINGIVATPLVGEDAQGEEDQTQRLKSENLINWP